MSGYIDVDGSPFVCFAHSGGGRKMNQPYRCFKCAEPLDVGTLYELKLRERFGTWHLCLKCYDDVMGELEDRALEIMGDKSTVRVAEPKVEGGQ